MEVIINQHIFNTDSENLEPILFAYGIKNRQGIAVAVNNKVIPKSRWNTHKISVHDSITIIKAAQGG